ncbi:MAG: hypothetical protein DRH03_11700 [Deltaproteobacteria bacterium]|nr:MAG: hypothetical protein DRH03_11700 [Deltaproteobacteria bacterium]
MKRIYTAVVVFLMISTSVLAAEVYIPHLTGGSSDWGDYLTVDNVGSTVATVMVTLYDGSGKLVYSGDHPVAKFAESVINLKSLSTVAQSGKVTYMATDLFFRVSFLNLTGGGVAEFRLSPVQSAALGFLFSDFEGVVAWKGIALANYGAAAVSVSLYALGGGEVLETAEISIPPHSKVSAPHSLWFPTLTMNEVKKIIAVASSTTLGGIAIAGNAACSRMLFTVAVPMASFSPDDPDAGYTGTWRGSWVSNAPGYSGAMVAYMIQDGGLVTGTVDVDNTDCGNVRGVPISGVVRDGIMVVSATHSCNGHTATLAYTQASRNGDTIYGTYRQDLDGRYYDSGTFSFTRD